MVKCSADLASPHLRNLRKKKKKKKEISPGMRKESGKNRARLRGLFYKNMKN